MAVHAPPMEVVEIVVVESKFHIYIRACVCVCMCMCACMHLCVRAYVCVCAYLRMCMCVCACNFIILEISLSKKAWAHFETSKMILTCAV